MSQFVYLVSFKNTTIYGVDKADNLDELNSQGRIVMILGVEDATQVLSHIVNKFSHEFASHTAMHGYQHCFEGHLRRMCKLMTLTMLTEQKEIRIPTQEQSHPRPEPYIFPPCPVYGIGLPPAYCQVKDKETGQVCGYTVDADGAYFEFHDDQMRQLCKRHQHEAQFDPYYWYLASYEQRSVVIDPKINALIMIVDQIVNMALMNDRHQKIIPKTNTTDRCQVKNCRRKFTNRGAYLLLENNQIKQLCQHHRQELNINNQLYETENYQPGNAWRDPSSPIQFIRVAELRKFDEEYDPPQCQFIHLRHAGNLPSAISKQCEQPVDEKGAYLRFNTGEIRQLCWQHHLQVVLDAKLLNLNRYVIGSPDRMLDHIQVIDEQDILDNISKV